MKKRVLALVMSTAMIASVLTACGGNNNTPSTDSNSNANSDANANNDANANSDANAGDDSAAGDTTPDDAATGDDGTALGGPSGENEIVIWVAENVQTFTQEQIAKFQEENSQYAGYSIRVEPVGEGDAANNMITDVEGGADIYGFAQDQLTRLVTAGAIAPVVGDYTQWVADNNDAGAVAAATVGGTVFAFPLTSDNGYFMYYDKSVISDPTSLDAIISDCEAAGKGFYMEINSGWYQPAFFFGAGCTLTYDTDDAGNYISCNIDYASDKGVAALKAIINLHKSPQFVNGSAVSNATNCAAIVDGTWDADAAKKLFGENYACAMLPKFTADGTEYQLGGFGGFKLLGLKPQTDADKFQACLAMAQFLSNEETQLARYEAVSWGPSNLVAQQSEAVQADEALSALAEQLAVSIPQGQYPGDYWTLATSLGDSIISGEYDNASDEELMAVLQQFQDTCISYAQ